MGINLAHSIKGGRSTVEQGASQLKQLKELQVENPKLKRMYTDKALQLEMAKDVISKK